MPYVFTIQNAPLTGDVATLAMTDGNAVQRAYEYTVQSGDTLQDVSDGIKALVNADIYFTAIDQTTYAGQVGLEVSQVATNAYALFSGTFFVALNPTVLSPAFTMAFDEANNAFEGERSYQPENWCCLGTLLISFKNGQLWTHDNTVYNNYYGIQYESTITGVFNESPLQKKTFMAIAEVANTVWDCPSITTNIPSTNTIQQSNLIVQDFAVIEGNNEASFLRDSNSQGGLINGDSLKGVYMIIQFRLSGAAASSYSYLGMLNLRFTDSSLNNR